MEEKRGRGWFGITLQEVKRKRCKLEAEKEKEKEWEKKEGWVEWEGEIRISKYLTYLYFRLDKMIDGKVKQVKNRKKRKQEPNQ